MKELKFDGEPALPIVAQGEIWHVGWDIATQWAFDSNDQCWMDNAHGHSLEKVSWEGLLGTAADDPSAAEKIRQVLGIPEPTNPHVELRNVRERINKLLMNSIRFQYDEGGSVLLFSWFEFHTAECEWITNEWLLETAHLLLGGNWEAGKASHAGNGHYSLKVKRKDG